MSCDDRAPDTVCCDSCHEDWDDYNIDMCWIGENLNTHVCCAVARALEPD